MPRPISFEEAKRAYPNRFTMEHRPHWASISYDLAEGKFYAPQYSTDQEWYDNTTFPGEYSNGYGISPRSKYCESRNQTFPLGEFLLEPYRKL